MTLIEIRSIQFIAHIRLWKYFFRFIRRSAQSSVEQYWLDKSGADQAVAVVLLNICGYCSTTVDKYIIGNERKK